ncbi:hypothetical protein MYG64_26345 (plasmid) [Ensifer adhaerens]|uniref:hypothetical protein n=1 Tax=Ensifer TaxID=106591 RepID=UPI0021010909|nr:hypothetical protein [Ensifer adhaerens]UTV39247.1 hypothetical protein MYG64_26345 [Ensifer adhaerens]
MDRAKFFAAVRSPFSISKNAQVQGIDAILDEAERRGTPTVRFQIGIAVRDHRNTQARGTVTVATNC